eukprot:Opistho-1_new@99825
MKYNIVIVGAGQLGSRYLQGLATVTEPLSIYVIDVDLASLDTAKSRWLEASGSNNLHEIQFLAEMGNLPATSHLAIVSTSSYVREKVVAALVTKTSVQNWILEKVLAQNISSLNTLEKLVGPNAWVNTFFRTLEWFKEIKKNTTNGPIYLEVNGGNWGIGCNTIHFIDLISWWTGETTTDFDCSRLDKEWYPAKRNGYWEINGCLRANFSQGSTAAFISDDSEAPFEIKIKTDKEEWLIEWDKGIATRNDGFVLPGKVLYQSEMTPGLAASILLGKGCELPSLSASVQQHEPFIESLLAHWNNTHSEKVTAVPIT